MTLEDFEKSLLQANGDDGNHEISSFSEKHSKRKKHHHRNHDMDDDRRYHRKRSRHSRKDDGNNEKTQSRNSKETENRNAIGSLQQEEEWIEKDIHPMRPANSDDTLGPSMIKDKVRRDSWMENPTSLDIEFKHRYPDSHSEPKIAESSNSRFDLRIHANELNKSHLQNLADGKDVKEDHIDDSARPAPADYIFGDAGSQWRMTKLKAVFKEAEETGTSVEQIAIERFGDLKAFDDLKEEQIELERRDTYGQDYVRKDKPSGGLHQERQAFKRFSGELVTSSGNEQPKAHDGVQSEQEEKPQGAYIPMDQTVLNKMKAQLMRAKLRGSADTSSLEKEYATAMSTLESRQEAEVIVLGAMQSRMIDGARKSEVEDTDHKRGRGKALEEVDEAMSIEDMVQEERRTRHQAGGDGQRFAERIAKDGKFNNHLEYLDENANKLAKRVKRSEINLRNFAVSEIQKIGRILDNCPLCHHEDENTPPIAPVVSLATRVYLTLPTEPEISDGGACIVPMQHHRNLLECDEDEWEEIRNFMKSLTRMYHDQGRDVIFYENAAAPSRMKHAGMEVVPLPYSLGETAPAFFKEAILSADEEWAQHKKLIDTLSKAKQGLGKLAFRRTLIKEMPYFHVWFEIDGGLGHVVEDSNRWPKGDLFAREVIGGMLDKGPDIIKRQGKWNKGGDRRVDGFRKRWKKFDWTRILTA